MRDFIKNWWKMLCIDAFCIIPAILYWFFPGIAYIVGGVVITLGALWILLGSVVDLILYDSFPEAMADYANGLNKEG